MRERRDDLAGVGVVADVERGSERVLQEHDCLVRLSEQVVEAAEVTQEPRAGGAVGELLVVLLRPLGVLPGEDPMPLTLGEERSLEVEVGEGPRTVHALRELERPLDVFARRLEVALTAVTARAPVQDRRAQLVAREA